MTGVSQATTPQKAPASPPGKEGLAPGNVLGERIILRERDWNALYIRQTTSLFVGFKRVIVRGPGIKKPRGAFRACSHACTK